MNLIPDEPGRTPSYWCTWGAQNYAGPAVDLFTWNGPFRQLNQELLFGEAGWATRFYEEARRDLYVMFDAGWDTSPDVAIDDERWRLGTLEVASERFPACRGAPAERLACLDGMCRDAGWRGAAIWVAPQMAGRVEPEQMARHRGYWQERAGWSAEAGIRYWKVDVGRHAADVTYRRMMTESCREVYPELRLEHAVNLGPLNDEPTPWSEVAASGSGRYGQWDGGGVRARALELLSFADVLRTYDVTAHLSAATTIDRVAELLAGARPGAVGEALLNVEDEAYLGAALGCAIGVMRHGAWREHDIDYDPHVWRQSLDEITRALRWQRLAPASGVHRLPVTLSETLLTDSWRFHEGETWAHFYWGERFEQAAPAVVARGMSLPAVWPGEEGDAQDDVPFVVAARHPNGATGVATLPRTSEARGIYHPRAHVSLPLGQLEGPLGVFGYYATLQLQLRPASGERRVWAQDLAGDKAEDVTGRVARTDEGLLFTGALLEELGLTTATPGDRSAPGLVIRLM